MTGASAPPTGLAGAVPCAVTCSHCGHTEHLIADRAQVSFMTDGHFFLQVPKLLPEQIIDWFCEQLRTDEGEQQNWTRYGMLCHVRISAKGRELRVVGQHVHPSGGSDEQIAKFRKDAEAWVAAIYADPDAIRLITAAAHKARGEAS